MTNVNPINGVPFGQEKTREDFLARAAWEYDQASRLRAAQRPVGYMALVEGHERAARDYERAANDRPSSPAPRVPLRTPLQEKKRARRSRAHATKAHWPYDVSVGDEVYAVAGGRRRGPGIVEELYDDGSMRVDFTRQFDGRLRLRPEDLILVPGDSHARKKKISPHEAKQLLQSDGIDFRRDFHELSSYEVQRILEIARLAGYQKRKDAPGSTARMYFQYLDRLRDHATQRKHTIYDLVEVNTRTKKERVLHEHFSTKADAHEAAAEYKTRKKPDVTYRIRSRKVLAPPYRWNPED